MLTTQSTALEGVLLIDKPSGCTSHDVVDHVRRKLGMKRIGHAGTLDPLATGLLVILVGKATKLSQYLMSLDKVYEGTLKLGETTDSQDADGELQETTPVPALDADALTCVLDTFLGDQYQTPPMFSAKKIKGVPLYKLARKGKTVEREPRFIRVASFDLLSFEQPYATFKVACTKGTYVRTLAHDVGQKIGCGAHLTALRRTQSDQFDVKNAVTLDTLDELSLMDIKQHLIPIYRAAPSYVL
tara:strand:+ start:29452 stop:30180 length:729 start_codon:yes stop_codon:yes gene_type:complete